jgi:hypothetical protein
MSLAGVIAGTCCCGGDCDCGTSAFTVDWTGVIDFEQVCGEKQFPECDDPVSRYAALSITSASIVVTQRASCSFFGYQEWTVDSTNCDDEGDVAEMTIRMEVTLTKSGTTPFDWFLNIKVKRFLNGDPYGIGFGSDPVIANWIYAPDCTPANGDCPCEGDWLLDCPSGGVACDDRGKEEFCDGYLLWQALEGGSVVLS